MIKTRTIGGIEKVIINPVLKSTSDITNYTFITDSGDVYLVSNTLTGDFSYQEDVVFKAGEYLNGYLIKSLEGLELVADEKHIAYGTSEDYDDIVAGTTLLGVDSDGKLAILSSAPSSGVYFKVTEKCRLTEKAVVIKVLIA